jgi:drug/metabolite transporter (DMT)-like permease
VFEVQQCENALRYLLPAKSVSSSATGSFTVPDSFAEVLAHILLLAAVVMWGWTFVGTKILVAELAPVDIFAARLAIGVPFLGILLLARGVRPHFGRADVTRLLLGGGVLTVHFLIQAVALTTTSASNSGWIIAVTPLVLAVVSYLVLRERLGWTAIAGIVVALLGVLLLVSRGRVRDLGALQTTGDWLMLLSTLTWAIFTAVTRDVARRHNPLAVTFAVMLAAAAVTAVLWWAAGNLEDLTTMSSRSLVALLYLGIAGLALGNWFWQFGIASVGAARAGLYLYLEPLATVALAAPLLGEPFGLFTALGGGLILGGVYLGQRGRSTAGPARIHPQVTSAER